MKQIKLYVVILLFVVLAVALVSIFLHEQTYKNSVSFLDQIKNYSYDVSSEGLYFAKGMFGPEQKDYDPKNVKLLNGSHDYGTYHNVLPSKCEEDVSHSISIAQNSSGQPLYAIGDLNGDGSDDMAVILSLTYREENMVCPKGFTATEDYIWNMPMLVVLENKGGKLQQTDSYINGRPGLPKIFDISGVAISNGVIALSGKNVEEYKVVSGKIVVVGKSFQTPSLPQNLKTYTNNDFGFSFQYPDSLNFTIQDVQPPALFIMKTDSKDNVFTVAVNADDFSSCISGGGPNDSLATEFMINGIPFYETSGGDAGMGHYSTTIQYSAFKNGKCYYIGLQYHTHRCDDCSSGQTDTQSVLRCNACTQENNLVTALSNIPDIIVSTFKFNPDMVQVPAPTCSIQTDKKYYKLGDVINLTWQSQNATGAFWNQPIDGGGIRKNIVSPEGNPQTNGRASTVANVEGDQTINFKVSGFGGVADCSASINITHSNATPSIIINGGTISSVPNGAGNSDVVLRGTATNGALYNDDINLVLFNADYAGPFDEATIYSNAFRAFGGNGWWLSGGAAIELRQDSASFKNWTVKIYAPAGTTRVRVLAYPFYSSSTTASTQPVANTIITLTPQ